jgi:hypothetical protein
MGEGVGALESMNVTAGDDARAAFDALLEFRAIAVVPTVLHVNKEQ